MSRFKKSVAAAAVAAAIGCGSPAVASAAPVVPALSSTTPEQRSEIRDALFTAHDLLEPYVPAQYKYGFNQLHGFLWGIFAPSSDLSAEYARMKDSLVKN